MLTTLRKRLTDEDEGFTLIELMVVVLIIAILIAIAIPTFLGAQDRARDRGAQSDLRNAMTAAKTIATDDAGLLTNASVTGLQDAEGALSFAAAGTTSEIGVNPAADPDDAVLLWTESESGTFYGIAASRTGDVGYCQGNAAAVDLVPAVDADGNLTNCNDTEW